MPEFSRELYSFVEIAQELSIRRAADKMNISSSALSRQMKLLEQDLGVKLLMRSVKGVQLTDQGHIFLARATKWLEEGNHLRTKLALQDTKQEKVLRIGAMECFATSLVPELFQWMRETNTIDRIEVKVGGTDSLIQNMQDRTVDLVVAFNVHQCQSIRILHEIPCKIGMIFSEKLCDLQDENIPISACLNWPICMPDMTLSLRTRLWAEILKQRRNVEVIASSNSVEFIRKLVVRGEAVSFLTWFDIRDEVMAGCARFVPLTNRRLVENVCICTSGFDSIMLPEVDIAVQKICEILKLQKRVTN